MVFCADTGLGQLLSAKYNCEGAARRNIVRWKFVEAESNRSWRDEDSSGKSGSDGVGKIGVHARLQDIC